MSNKQFLLALDKAVDDSDMYELRMLEKKAFDENNVDWQQAARHASNYLFFAKRGNIEMQNNMKLCFQEVANKLLQKD